MMLGRVDEVDGHYVATRFVALLVPTESVYVTSSTARSSVTSVALPLKVKTDWRSIGLAYGRVWLPILGVALVVAPIALGVGFSIVTLLVAVGCGIVAGMAHHTGRLPDKVKARLRLLGTVTGLRIDPSRLLDATRTTKRNALGELMEKGGIPITPADIVSVIDDIPIPAMALVYGYACYSGDDPEWRDCAEQIYLRHEAADV